jgi:hypothetical protein
VEEASILHAIKLVIAHPNVKKQGYKIYNRIRRAKNKYQTFTPLFTQRTEWAPQIALTHEQEEHYKLLNIAQNPRFVTANYYLLNCKSCSTLI